MSYGTIKFEVKDSLCWIGLSREDTRNAINAQMCLEITDAMQRAVRDKQVRVVIVYGVGHCFSAGGDLKSELPSLDDDVLETIYKPMLLSVFHSTKPVVCMVHAYAIGVASALAMAADFLFMEDDAYLMQPFIGIGLIPDGGVTWHLVNHLGRKKALEVIVSGEKISASDCVTLGISNRSCPAEKLTDETQEWAESVAEKPPLAIRYAKEALNKAMELNLADAISYEARLQNITMLSDDSQEGVLAFFEKRKPRFKGQ